MSALQDGSTHVLLVYSMARCTQASARHVISQDFARHNVLFDEHRTLPALPALDVALRKRPLGAPARLVPDEAARGIEIIDCVIVRIWRVAIISLRDAKAHNTSRAWYTHRGFLTDISESY